MLNTRRVIEIFSVVALAGGLPACAKEEPKPAPPAVSAPPPVSTPPTPPPAPVATAPEKKASHPCPEHSEGKGTQDAPCIAKGKTRMMEVTWNKKIEEKGPTFKIVNKAKLDVLYGKIAVYFYDKAGKQIEIPGSEKPRKRLTCGGNIFAGVVKPGEKVFMNFSCVKKDDVPQGATAIEGEITAVGFTDDAGNNDTYWHNDDLAPDERPKGGIK